MKPSANTDSKSAVEYLLDERNSVALLIFVAVGSGLVGLVAHFFALPAWISVTATFAVVLASPVVLKLIHGDFQGCTALKVAATAATVVTTGWLVVAFSVGTDDRVIMTGANEPTVAYLSDGSVVSVAVRSTVRVNETAQRRVARLEAGEVVFTVTPNATTPFVVETYRASMTSPGGKFRVTIDSSVEIEVYEGAVRVFARGANMGPQSLILQKGSPPYRVPSDGIAAVAANGIGGVVEVLVGG